MSVYAIQRNSDRRWFQGYNGNTGVPFFDTRSWAQYYNTTREADTARTRLCATLNMVGECVNFTFFDIKKV